MLNIFCSRVTPCLPDQPALARRVLDYRRATPEVKMLLLQVTAQMSPSILTAEAFTRYPWCFIARDRRAKKKKRYFIGAFIPPAAGESLLPGMIYTVVNEAWLLRHMTQRANLPLAMARALMPLMIRKPQTYHYQEVRRACRALPHLLVSKGNGPQHAPSAVVERLLQSLGEVQCDADAELKEQHGVDAMPWMDWPGCIRNEATIWLWRQSRYGKVVESQKINKLN